MLNDETFSLFSLFFLQNLKKITGISLAFAGIVWYSQLKMAEAAAASSAVGEFFFDIEGYEKRESGKKTHSRPPFKNKNTLQAPAAPRPRGKESAAQRPSRSRASPRRPPRLWAWSASGRTRGLDEEDEDEFFFFFFFFFGAFFLFFRFPFFPVPSIVFYFPGFELRLCKLKRTTFFII